jgi:hypothetical protein
VEYRVPLTGDHPRARAEPSSPSRPADEADAAQGYRLVDPDPDVEVARIRRLLAAMPGVEQAKGILMVRRGVDADAAFTLLQRWSQDTNTRLVHLCASVVDAAGQPDGGVALGRLLRQRFPDEPGAARQPGRGRSRR